MTGDLQFPRDFERLPEFRTLVTLLKAKQTQEVTQKWLECTATFIWVRLWVELAFLAQTTNRPGYLTSQGRMLFESTLEPLFGENCNPTLLLRDAQALQQGENGEEFFCVRFAQMNKHFSGDHVKKEKVGQAASLLQRRKQHIAHEANAQALLLPPDVFKNENGETLSPADIQRAMVLIKTLDNCLGSPVRKTGQYTEGLIADADKMMKVYSERQELTRNLFVWIMNHRDHPRLPKTTEQILRDFDNVVAMAE